MLTARQLALRLKSLLAIAVPGLISRFIVVNPKKDVEAAAQDIHGFFLMG